MDKIEQTNLEGQINIDNEVKIENKSIQKIKWVTLKELIIVILIVSLIVLIEAYYVHNNTSNRPHSIDKPVIYLYPDVKSDINVKLDYKWEIIADLPKYNEETKWWDVIAYPDSKIINKADNKEYSYLFWEGNQSNYIDWNFDKWFVVKWSESREFLQEVLPKIGLTPKEYNEFIVYWYPLMQKNEYNLVNFAWKQYTDLAKLETEPKYDSLLRVFMVFKAIDKPINIPAQTFEKFDRKWFTVVEWWGTQVK